MRIHGAEFYTLEELQAVMQYADYVQTTTYDYSMSTSRYVRDPRRDAVIVPECLSLSLSLSHRMLAII